MWSRAGGGYDRRMHVTPSLPLLKRVPPGAWAVLEGRVASKDFTFMITELLLGGALRREEP